MESLYDFIYKEDKSAARSVVEKIYHSCLNIEIFPLAGRVGIVDSTREFVIPKTKYIIVYKVVDTRVIVIGLYHTAMSR
jgi:addiction module RelE/StbE family toxin